MSLTLRAGFTIRVCDPANAVATLHPGYANDYAARAPYFLTISIASSSDCS